MAKKEKIRCAWAGTDPLMIAYHDTEWGRPVHEDQTHFEFLVLESAQAGLSWSTILKKREGYRRAFANFNPKAVAKFSPQKIETLIGNPEIVRNRLKIAATVTNAIAFLKIQEEFGSFDAYCWQFVGRAPLINQRKTMKDVPATSPASDAFSKDLKKRGFKFVGSTIIYAHMQAVGMVNDHTMDCFCFRKTASNS